MSGSSSIFQNRWLRHPVATPGPICWSRRRRSSPRAYQGYSQYLACHGLAEASKSKDCGSRDSRYFRREKGLHCPLCCLIGSGFNRQPPMCRIVPRSDCQSLASSARSTARSPIGSTRSTNWRLAHVLCLTSCEDRRAAAEAAPCSQWALALL